jgi:hypothetical protein
MIENRIPFNDDIAKMLFEALNLLVIHHLQSPEVVQIIDEKIDHKVREVSSEPKRYTQKQVADQCQVSEATIRRLHEDQIEKVGYIREKVGVQIRYRWIGIEKPSKETYKEAKRIR